MGAMGRRYLRLTTAAPLCQQGGDGGGRRGEDVGWHDCFQPILPVAIRLRVGIGTGGWWLEGIRTGKLSSKMKTVGGVI